MLTSLIVDARSAGSRLPRQLGALRKAARQRAGRVELLVVDDTGDDRLVALARRFNTRLVTSPPSPLGHRLNVAAAASQGQIIGFAVASEHLAADWLARLSENLERQALEAVIVQGQRPCPLRMLARLFRHPAAEALVVTRDWFERIGGFDDALDDDPLADLITRLRACQARVVSQAG